MQYFDLESLDRTSHNAWRFSVKDGMLIMESEYAFKPTNGSTHHAICELTIMIPAMGIDPTTDDGHTVCLLLARQIANNTIKGSLIQRAQTEARFAAVFDLDDCKPKSRAKISPEEAARRALAKLPEAMRKAILDEMGH
jgi:hypothetical protein